METLALALILVSVAGMSGHSVLRKWLFNNNAMTESESLILTSGIATLVCGTWFFVWTDWDTIAPSNANITMFLIALVGTTIANIALQFAHTRATRLAELSLTAPISALTPGFVFGCAMLFGEVPSTLGYIGIGLIIIGAYVHAREGSRFIEYLQPLFVWTIFQKLSSITDTKKRNDRLALRWAYGGALFCSTPGLIFDGLLARHGNMALGVTIELFCLTVAFSMLRARQGSQTHDVPFLVRFKLYWRQMVGMGVCYSLPFVLLGVAFRLAPIAYVGSLKRLSILLTLILAMWLLGEMKTSKRRMVTGSIITLGAMILAFDPTPAVLINNLDEYLKRIVG